MVEGAVAGRVEPPLAAAPRRIVPATAAAAEYVVALVGAERIVALPEQVDGFATREFRSAGLGALPRFPKYLSEPILAREPDLVIAMAWQSADTTATLRAQGIPVLVLRSATDYAAVRATLETLGEVLDARETARSIAAALDARVERLRERAAARPRQRALVYTNDGTGGWIAGARTTADAVLALVGLRNAGAEDGVDEHQRVDFERVIRIDPDVFVIGTPEPGVGGGATQDLLSSAEPLAGLAAVRARRFALVPSALLSADSPALVDAAEALEKEIERLPR